MEHSLVLEGGMQEQSPHMLTRNRQGWGELQTREGSRRTETSNLRQVSQCLLGYFVFSKIIPEHTAALLMALGIAGMSQPA